MLSVSLLGFPGLLPLGYAVLPGLSLLRPKLTPIQKKMSLHTSSAALPHSSLPITLFSPSWFYSLAPTPSFFHSPSSHRHPSFLCFAALLSSHFPSLPLFLPLLGADQFTVSLGGVRKAPAHPHPSTRSHPYPSNPEWITFQIIHPWIFFFFWVTGSGEFKWWWWCRWYSFPPVLQFLLSSFFTSSCLFLSLQKCLRHH